MTTDEVLREKLKKTYWLGGMSCSGKTTIASVLSERYRLPVHHRDDAMASHSERATPDRHPTKCKWRDILQTKAMYEQLQRPIDELIDEISESAQEDFDMTREDFSDMSFEDATLIEGARLWPKLVNEILADRSHAVWLLPTTQMYQEVLAKREGMTQFWQIVACQVWLHKPALVDFVDSPATNGGVRQMGMSNSRDRGEGGRGGLV